MIDVMKWVKTLRSGSHKQGTGQFCFENKYCCLGVLAETQVIPETVSFDVYEFHEVPTTWHRATGFKDKWWEENTPFDAKFQVTLMDLNDGYEDKGIRKHTFAEIADIIEEKYREMSSS